MGYIKDVPCPNCNESVVRFIYFDPPRPRTSHVGMAVHREVVGNDGRKIPESFCYLGQDDWDVALGEMQDKKDCDCCSSIYKDGCSRTLRECLQKQREHAEKIDNGVI